MGYTWRDRLGYWLETFPLGRRLAFKRAGPPHLEYLMINRINGHVIRADEL